jgi:hypothetical protein
MARCDEILLSEAYRGIISPFSTKEIFERQIYADERHETKPVRPRSGDGERKVIV